MAARPKSTDRVRALRLACWNAERVRGRKLELEHFLSQHGVEICLLGEIFLSLAKPSGLLIMSATAQRE
jgi:hypothetical protein